MLLLLLAIPALMLWAVPYRRWGLRLPFDHQLHPSRRWLSILLATFDCAPALLLATTIVHLDARPLGPNASRATRATRRACNHSAIPTITSTANAMMMCELCII